MSQYARTKNRLAHNFPVIRAETLLEIVQTENGNLDTSGRELERALRDLKKETIKARNVF